MEGPTRAPSQEVVDRYPVGRLGSNAVASKLDKKVKLACDKNHFPNFIDVLG